jgi:hypothetical protein
MSSVITFEKFKYSDLVKDELMGRLCSMNVWLFFVRESEGKVPLRRPRGDVAGSIKINLREIGWGGQPWVVTSGVNL